MATYEVFQEFERVRDFRCIADRCEDSCCYGWKVSVSKQNYDKYVACPDPTLGQKLSQLVAPDPQSKTSETFASLTLPATGCRFLSDKLCSIQSQLGEDYLPSACDTFPRVMNGSAQRLETSLDLACPEAARLVLLDPKPLRWIKVSAPASLNPNLVISKTDTGSPVTEESSQTIQAEVLALLQRRDLPVWKRLGLLGHVVESASDDASADGRLVEALRYVNTGSTADLANPDIDDSVQSSTELACNIELIIVRLRADYTAPRFQECYREFMSGIGWTDQSSLEGMHAGYSLAYQEFFLPFLSRHEHMLEHLLVNEIVSNRFPSGSSGLQKKLGAERCTASNQFIQIATNFSLVQLLLIGAAGFHKDRFDAAQAVRVVQSCARALDHSVSFPPHARDLFTLKGMLAPTALLPLYSPPAP